jgi:hypothetical protein
MKTEIIEVELPRGVIDVIKVESERRGETVGKYLERAVVSSITAEIRR